MSNSVKPTISSLVTYLTTFDDIQRLTSATRRRELSNYQLSTNRKWLHLAHERIRCSPTWRILATVRIYLIYIDTLFMIAHCPANPGRTAYWPTALARSLTKRRRSEPLWTVVSAEMRCKTTGQQGPYWENLDQIFGNFSRQEFNKTISTFWL